ncbi:hypothetical protein PPACK8108_LOCUS23405 [Phakopsora pachyrhizi]|uniref:Uncharacterized protein n=1 Tax=Phakopsora pachyrhizi TaxID=170000 RepID=A0AAV0BQ01_PHAPC|nr:hypothetical protein PPACK8108_LOCUS23405 [Phakopsora pachyrhizi]
MHLFTAICFASPIPYFLKIEENEVSVGDLNENNESDESLVEVNSSISNNSNSSSSKNNNSNSNSNNNNNNTNSFSSSSSSSQVLVNNNNINSIRKKSNKLEYNGSGFINEIIVTSSQTSMNDGVGTGNSSLTALLRLIRLDCLVQALRLWEIVEASGISKNDADVGNKNGNSKTNEPRADGGISMGIPALFLNSADPINGFNMQFEASTSGSYKKSIFKELTSMDPAEKVLDLVFPLGRQSIPINGLPVIVLRSFKD